MINFQDVFQFSNEEKAKVKCKFNIWGKDTSNPLDIFKNNPEEVNVNWLFWRNERRNFDVGNIAVCFIKIDYDNWLLTTIKKVTKELDVKNGVNYEGEELVEYKKYFGRVIVKYHKSAQGTTFNYETVAKDMEILKILPDIFDDEPFPGYDNVKISYQKLASIINRSQRDWQAALQGQKGVYLITDTATGKLYVGSATGEKGLYQRWSDYVANGHGGDVELIKLVNEKGFDYVKNNFQYSILENYNARTDDKYILGRESWWKEVVGSRKFGYNAN